MCTSSEDMEDNLHVPLVSEHQNIQGSEQKKLKGQKKVNSLREESPAFELPDRCKSSTQSLNQLNNIRNLHDRKTNVARNTGPNDLDFSTESKATAPKFANDNLQRTSINNDVKSEQNICIAEDITPGHQKKTNILRNNVRSSSELEANKILSKQIQKSIIPPADIGVGLTKPARTIGSTTKDLNDVLLTSAETVTVKSEFDLIYATTISNESKLITFESSLPEFNFGKINVYFPKFSSLGERKINFEIMMPSNETSDSTVFVTPVLYISQKKHIPFLHQVTVAMQLNEQFDQNASISKTGTNTEIKIVDNICVIKADSFSPVAALQEMCGSSDPNSMPSIVRNLSCFFNQIVLILFFEQLLRKL